MTYEEAVSVWVSRHCHKRGIFSADEIADIEFGIGEGWPGTEVTPGEPDFAAVRFRLRHGDEWTRHTICLDGMDPTQLIAECLEIMKGDATDSPTTPEVDRALKRVQTAHWGGSLKPTTEVVTTPVFVRFLRDARTLASEVRRLRTVAGLARSETSSK